jgi:hypothetical protein
VRRGAEGPGPRCVGASSEPNATAIQVRAAVLTQRPSARPSASR